MNKRKSLVLTVYINTGKKATSFYQIKNFSEKK